LVGAILAHSLVLAFGVCAYLIPLFTLIWAISYFRLQAPQRGWLTLLGSGLFLLASCSLISLYFKGPLAFWGTTFYPPGGKVGDFISYGLLFPYFSSWGAYLISSTFFILSIMLATGFSFITLWEHLGKLSGFIISHTRKVSKKEPKKASLKKENPTPIITTPKVQEEAPPEVTFLSEPPSRTQPGMHQKPPLSLLETPKHLNREEIIKDVPQNSSILEAKLKDFGVEGRITQVHPGPVITRYEFEPAPGVKINQVANLADDLALAMRASAVRIVAPIPGKAAVGIEVPNQKRELIYLQEILGSENFRHSNYKLALALGKDIAGVPYVTDLAKMPHLLIAGATGSGKSVALNTIICSILYNATPQEVRLVMLDPKMLELGIYDGIPHLLVPVVTDAKEAAGVLFRATQLMEERYRLLAEAQVRNIDQYNRLIAEDAAKIPSDGAEGESFGPMPRIVIIIDEFADLMMVASKDVEGLITRLTQMSRAVGIHLVIATQRPSVDVITGLIKANFPSRISFRVSSRTDSRTILDSIGAERLLGRGDMLFLPPGSADLVRIHGALVTEKEIKKIVDFLSRQGAPQYDTSFLAPSLQETTPSPEDEYDEIYDKAVDFAIQKGQISISMLQRRFRVGYNRAARMVEIMERDGVVGPSLGGKPRKVLVGKGHEA